jgi:hypothetical protein
MISPIQIFQLKFCMHFSYRMHATVAAHLYPLNYEISLVGNFKNTYLV